MAEPATLTPEAVRLLRAARDGRLNINPGGRYVITGEHRPDRLTREKLMRERLLTWRFRPAGLEITAFGLARINDFDRADAS